MIIKLLVSLFVLFAVSRVWLRRRDGSIGMLGSVIWSVLWLAIVAFVWWPGVSNSFAHLLGVGRGVDAVVDVSIVVLFYSVFRMYVKLEFVEHELTSLVRSLAIDRARDQTDGT